MKSVVSVFVALALLGSGALAYHLHHGARAEAIGRGAREFDEALARRDVDGLIRACASRHAAKLQQARRVIARSLARQRPYRIEDYEVMKTDIDVNHVARVSVRYAQVDLQNGQKTTTAGMTEQLLLVQDEGRWKVVAVGGVEVVAWLSGWGG